ncbi:MAG: GspH/FimT family protein [Acidobacteria bacterium]|nr:GspH/FimT family protein [Acidobacteriota bacterium]
MAVPQMLSGLDRSRARAAARFLAARMTAARTYAVLRSANVALRFVDDRTGVTFQTFVDHNQNGVRTSDIAADVDRPLDAPARLPELFPGVEIALAPELGADPVRFGSSDLLSFTPLGTATPGTVYIRGRDGTQLAVRVLGATARTRVLYYAPRARRWMETF